MILIPQLSVASIIDSYRLHDSKMRQRNGLGATGATEDVSTVSAVVFAVGKGKLLATSHADVGVSPFGWCRTIEHAAGNLLSGWKVEAFVLQRFVAFGEVVQAVLSLCANSPILDELEHLTSHIDVATFGHLQQADKVIHELPASNLLHKVAASILGACVGKVQGSKLDVWILVAYAAL